MIREQPRPELSDARSAWTGLFREHPGLLLTAGYLALTIVGLIYELWFFSYFGINILEYVETSDFLLAALRTPLVIVLSALPLLLVWLLWWCPRRRAGPAGGCRELDGGFSSGVLGYVLSREAGEDKEEAWIGVSPG